jgi:phosphatidylglycerol:prolipoprotein diacylglycerol transferase
LYPTLPFHPFGIDISTFGILVALGFLVGGWVFARALERAGSDADASSILFWAMVGGLLGSKLWFTVEMMVREPDVPVLSFLLSRGGLTWYGGLVGGTLAVILAGHLQSVPLRLLTHCGAPAITVGQLFGRIGCFLVGDDYGYPTDLPWGIAFPEGTPKTDVPVHPTMLYEAAWLTLLAGFLWKRQGRSPYLFGEYLVLAGVGRFLDELFRINPPLLGPFSNAQVTALVSIVVGAALWLHFRRVPWQQESPSAAEPDSVHG